MFGQFEKNHLLSKLMKTLFRRVTSALSSLLLVEEQDKQVCFRNFWSIFTFRGIAAGVDWPRLKHLSRGGGWWLLKPEKSQNYSSGFRGQTIPCPLLWKYATFVVMLLNSGKTNQSLKGLIPGWRETPNWIRNRNSWLQNLLKVNPLQLDLFALAPVPDPAREVSTNVKIWKGFIKVVSVDDLSTENRISVVPKPKSSNVI